MGGEGGAWGQLSSQGRSLPNCPTDKAAHGKTQQRLQRKGWFGGTGSEQGRSQGNGEESGTGWERILRDPL